MKRLLQILTGFAFLLWPMAEALSLPPCPKDPNRTYHNCFGSYTFDSGAKYVGEWKDDKKHGQGTFYWSDGDKYVGEFKNDKKQGQGTYYYSNGNKKYEGEWKDDEYHGQGTRYWSDGRYEGEWKDGKRHGQGILYYSDGRYEGEWKDGKRHGQGTFYYSDGDTDKGEWKDDKLVDKELDLWDILWKILEYIVYAILVLFGLLLWWLWSGTNDSEEYEDD